MKKEYFVGHFTKYVSEQAASLFYEWVKNEPLSFKITQPRNSKLGDFRTPSKGSNARISINGNLNEYAFTVTFIHELAHYLDFKTRKTLRNPHGKSWKDSYSKLLSQALDANLFPSKLKPVIIAHIQNPKAASCSDPELTEALRLFDEAPMPLLKELSDNSYFELNNGMQFKKGPLRRTRFRCQNINDGRWYLIHGSAEVTPLKQIEMKS